MNSLCFFLSIISCLQLEDLLSDLMFFMYLKRIILPILSSPAIFFSFSTFSRVFFFPALLTSFYNLSSPPVFLDVLCHSLTFFLHSAFLYSVTVTCFVLVINGVAGVCITTIKA